MQSMFEFLKPGGSYDDRTRSVAGESAWLTQKSLRQFPWLPLAAVLAVHTGLNLLYFPYLKTAEAAYFSESFLAGALALRWESRRILLLLAVAVLTPVVTVRRLTWKSIDPEGGLRAFLLAVVAMTTWINGLYPYNFYFGEFHLLDRLLVVLTGIAVVWRPGFVSLHLMFALISNYQLDFPFGHNGEWTNRMLLYQLLILFHALLLWFCVADRMASFESQVKRDPERQRLAFFSLACLVMVFYFVPGVAKLSVGRTPAEWLARNDVGNLMVSAYVSGWNLVSSQDAVLSAASLAGEMGLVLGLAVLGIELASPLSFFGPRTFSPCRPGESCYILESSWRPGFSSGTGS